MRLESCGAFSRSKRVEAVCTFRSIFLSTNMPLLVTGTAIEWEDEFDEVVLEFRSLRSESTTGPSDFQRPARISDNYNYSSHEIYPYVCVGCT